jgi:outer membrane protein OmpA-like peptidoglycan-associated protein
VKTWLVAHGGPQIEARIAVRGYGEAKPALPNDSEANRAVNRRVELRLDR